jgi:phage terminase Nu1 subunit (DNA packaging protein)
MARVTTVDTTQFAKLVGITPRHVNRLTADGVLVKARDEQGRELRNRFELAHNILAYCNYLRTKARLDDVSENKYHQLRNEKMGAENQMVQLKLLVMKGKLHRSEDVEFHITNQLTHFKARVLAIPSKIARLLVGQTKFQVIYDIIMSEIELVLREFTGYDPRMFRQQSEAFLASEGADLDSLNGTEPNGEEDTPIDES